MLVAALLAVGCGSVSKADYAKELRDTMGDLESSYGDAIGEAGGGNATPADAAKLRTAQLALRDAASRLDEIEPPEELRDEHHDLVQGVRDMADAVTLLVRATELADTNPTKARALTAKFASDDSFRRVGDAAARLDRAGVDAGL
ncbi:MAG: hypothetical protein JWM98_1111 [Thermoleophilia bacterium]|nr:hypothetical protein [Thermoleophilia bacterium]